MKKRLLAVVLVIVFMISACGKNQKQAEELDDALDKIESLKKDLQQAKTESKKKTEEIDNLQKELNDTREALQKNQEELETIGDTLDKTKKQVEEERKEFNEYKEKMSQYEDLSEAEKEAREAEARMTIEKEQEEKRKKEQEAEEARQRELEEKQQEEEKRRKEQEEKEKKGYDTGITYDQLARTPDKYKGEKVKFTGEILQILEDDEMNEMRLSVHKNSYGWYDSEQVIYCAYIPAIVDYRLLDGDVVTIYGIASGIVSYQTVMGNTITLPLVYVEKIEQKK